MKKNYKIIIGLFLIAVLGFGICLNVFITDNIFSSDVADISSDSTGVSEVMTFDELMVEIARDNNISVEAAKKQYYETHNIAYESEASVVPDADTYRIVSITLPVADVYKPQLKVYCQTSEDETMWGICEILNVNMNRTYNNLSKEFAGSVYVNLEDEGTIYWTIDGDFFNHGKTNVSANGVPGDSSASVAYGVTDASNHYITYWGEGRWRN